MNVKEYETLLATIDEMVRRSADDPTQRTLWSRTAERSIRLAMSEFDAAMSSELSEPQSSAAENMRRKLTESILRFQLVTGIVVDSEERYVPLSIGRRGKAD